MPAYENTSVPVAQSKASIEQLLRKYHVGDIRWTESATQEIFSVEFNYPIKRERVGTVRVPDARGRSVLRDKYEVRVVAGVRIQVPWPSDDREQRRRARVLYWHLKSKLEAVENGVVSFTEEFLPHIHIGGGRTVYEALAPLVQRKSEESGGDLSLAFGAVIDDGTKALDAGGAR